jgi:hypothetical protein
MWENQTSIANFPDDGPLDFYPVHREVNNVRNEQLAAPRIFHRPPHPFKRPAAIDTPRTPDISRQTCESDSPLAFETADNLPGAETIVRHS